MKHSIRYITTDLDLLATLDLALLADAMPQEGLFAFHGGTEGSWYARFGATSGFHEPDQDIDAMLTAIEPLYSMAKKILVLPALS